MYFLILCSLAYIPFVESGAGIRWHYEQDGPAHWAENYPDCGKNKQSPINIDTKDVIVDSNLSKFNLTNYAHTSGIVYHLENVFGHTAEVKYSGSPLIISGGNLPGEYMVDQFHFHWGKVDGRGSEHKVDGKAFDMEMHIVHHSIQYQNVAEAMDKPNGLAVLGFFFEVGPNENTKFKTILSHFDEIEYSGQNIPLHESIKLSSMLPDDLSTFYTYEGSLTTPPCFESVIWTLFKKPIQISEGQLNVFRSLKRTEKGDLESPLVDDFRPVQNLNSRVVKTNSLEVCDENNV